MYLVEVEFYTWVDMSTITKAEYIDGLTAIFRVKGDGDLFLFEAESETRPEVKKYRVYKYQTK